MKKITAFAFIAVFFTACSIGGAEKVQNNIGAPFKSNIELTWCDKQYKGEIIRKDAESIEISVAGEALHEPISYSIVNGGLTIKTGDLELTLPYKDAPQESLIITVYESFLLIPQAEIITENESVIFKHPKAILTYDNKSEKIMEMNMKDGKLKFIDFEYL